MSLPRQSPIGSRTLRPRFRVLTSRQRSRNRGPSLCTGLVRRSSLTAHNATGTKSLISDQKRQQKATTTKTPRQSQPLKLRPRVRPTHVCHLDPFFNPDFIPSSTTGQKVQDLHLDRQGHQSGPFQVQAQVQRRRTRR